MSPERDDRVTEIIHKAMSHPLRRRILRRLRDADQPLAPKDFETETGEKLSNVSYHFRVLHEAALIDLARTEPRRGSVKHFYVPSKAFTPQIKDALALDQIA